jgi:hypothetical protein
MRSKLSGGKVGLALNKLKLGLKKEEDGLMTLTEGGAAEVGDSSINRQLKRKRKTDLKSAFNWLRYPAHECNNVRTEYQKSLKQLEVVIQKENRNEIKPGDPLNI